MARDIPELLAPAGSLEKLMVAVLYGADALYLGGQHFGLRTAADNFTERELSEGVSFAHKHRVKVYVVVNAYLHDSELINLPPYLKFLEEIGVDALIVADMGVLKVVRSVCSIPIHLSTQANALNSYSARFWQRAGVDRIILGREVSIEDAGAIRQMTGIPVEIFIHGSMCSSYSGNCVISNFTQGRDSNRGGCAHSCRFAYSFTNPSGEKVTPNSPYFLSSKDLNGLALLPQVVESKIDSIKIEGRMKGHHYAGVVTKSYATMLANYQASGRWNQLLFKQQELELGRVINRDYTNGNLVEIAGSDSIYCDRENRQAEYQMVGIVHQVVEGEFLLVEVKSAFETDDTLEIIPFEGETLSLPLLWIKNLAGDSVGRTRPSTMVKLPYIVGAKSFNLVRLKSDGPCS
jgi:U32 family peptidase